MLRLIGGRLQNAGVATLRRFSSSPAYKSGIKQDAIIFGKHLRRDGLTFALFATGISLAVYTRYQVITNKLLANISSELFFL